MTANNISLALKVAASMLEYPIIKGIPIKQIKTHSLRSGDANALALMGYLDTQIQKWGNGVALLSRSTSKTSWHVSQRAYPRI